VLRVADAVLWRPMPSAPPAPAVTALLTYALLVGTYFIVRPWLNFAEQDSGVHATSIHAATAAASLTPSNGLTYGHGFLNVASSAVLLAFAGIDVAAAQQLVFPLFAALLVLPGWALFREVAGSRAAGIGVLLLFSQPEFLFVVLRGSHERLLRFLMLLALWLLVRSFKVRETPRLYAIHVALFYACAFALIGANALFGVSFVAAVALAMVGAWVSGSSLSGVRRLASGGVAARLSAVTMALAGIAFMVVFYVYPAASGGLREMTTVTRSAAALVLTTETGVDPYAQAVGGWVSQRAYLVLSFSDYLLMASSAVVWLWEGLWWATGRRRARWSEARDRGYWLLWLLYGAFALQGVLAMVADRTGLLGGNLQHRSFPSFAMVAIPLVAAFAARRLPRPAATVASTGVAALAGLALLKATNEPALSNAWTLYTTPERRALEWIDRRHEHQWIWVGPRERLVAASGVVIGPSRRGNQLDAFAPKPATRAFLVTDLLALESQRLRRPLPAGIADNRVYDSGSAQLYRLRPRTALQR
jgi:hypothetical protein